MILMIYDKLGDRIIGDRIVASYQDFQPKKGYRTVPDGRNEMTLRKSVVCRIEKPIRVKQ